jgi:hypothetical protein
MYAGRMLYADFHPGNFLVLDDSRLGVIDFGFMLSLEGEEWELYRKMDKAITTGRREDRLPILKQWSDIRDDETERLRLSDEFADGWRPRCSGGIRFRRRYFRRGIDLFTKWSAVLVARVPTRRHISASLACGPGT